MTTFLIIIAAILAGALIYLASLNGDYRIDRSLLIDAPVDRVYQAVVDFKTWPEWSPWLLHEPDARLEYSDDYREPGGFYTWDGKLVGAGKLTHIEQRDNEALEQRIEFLRPFKSTSRVAWEFKPAGEQTEVHWIMQGRMPFLFRFMTQMMQGMIARDYDLGLNLLNGYLDPANPHPRISFPGEQPLDDFDYMYQPFSATAEELPATMEREYPKLIGRARELDAINGFPCTIYSRSDPKNMYFEGYMAVPVAAGKLPADVDRRHFTGGRYFRTRLQGDYRFMELAWYKAHSHLQMAKIKLDKQRPMLEVYENDAQEIADRAELLTSIYLPVKQCVGTECFSRLTAAPVAGWRSAPGSRRYPIPASQ